MRSALSAPHFALKYVACIDFFFYLEVNALNAAFLLSVITYILRLWLVTKVSTGVSKTVTVASQNVTSDLFLITCVEVQHTAKFGRSPAVSQYFVLIY
jgi:hypothetical protein